MGQGSHVERETSSAAAMVNKCICGLKVSTVINRSVCGLKPLTLTQQKHITRNNKHNLKKVGKGFWIAIDLENAKVLLIDTWCKSRS